MAPHLQWFTASREPLDHDGPVEVPFDPFEPVWISRPICERFDQIARRHSEKTAVDDGEICFTYGEIHRASLVLARSIEARVQPGRPVGVLLEHSAFFPIAALACLRTGRPIVPIDQGHPVERNILIAREAGLQAVIFDGLVTDLNGLLQDAVWFDVVSSLGVLSDAEPEMAPADGAAFILYTSGSTAKPKGILHTTGGYLTGVAATHRYVFDLEPESDVYWCAADVGWVTGHSYIVYGPLANGATSVMWEGAPDYPDKGIWWEIVERYGVSILYCAPTAIRACIKWGADWPNKHDLSSLRLLGSVGEPINPKAWLWYHKVIGAERCPIVDTWWQTETGGIMITPLPGITQTKPGSATHPFPGVFAEVRDESTGEAIDEGQGLLVLTQPWPSMLRTLYKEPERFIETYFKRFGNETYLVGDAARRDSDGYLWVIGRIDDVVNVSGHRLSTAEVESAIVAHADVAEAAVIGQHDEDTGQAIVAFVTLQGDLAGDERTVEGIRATVAERIGKFARPKRIIWADDLPKTRSGKIMRRLLRDIAEGRALGDVTTLRDPAVTAQLEDRVREMQAQED